MKGGAALAPDRKILKIYTRPSWLIQTDVQNILEAGKEMLGWICEAFFMDLDLISEDLQIDIPLDST
jgi:hypothetical protein